MPEFRVMRPSLPSTSRSSIAGKTGGVMAERCFAKSTGVGVLRFWRETSYEHPISAVREERLPTPPASVPKPQKSDPFPERFCDDFSESELKPLGPAPKFSPARFEAIFSTFVCSDDDSDVEVPEEYELQAPNIDATKPCPSPRKKALRDTDIIESHKAACKSAEIKNLREEEAKCRANKKQACRGFPKPLPESKSIAPLPKNPTTEDIEKFLELPKGDHLSKGPPKTKEGMKKYMASDPWPGQKLVYRSEWREEVMMDRDEFSRKKRRREEEEIEREEARLLGSPPKRRDSIWSAQAIPKADLFDAYGQPKTGDMAAPAHSTRRANKRQRIA
ncbi:Hypothetical predicted protein [Lecanosticta acicola]|uniref:Uncharacterized protein n=1 Tax=Lecanosticta acicola TaxID=111012 RepID=A0AAI8YSV1_9PEZI|nr:Hypothetical predicted protein [Lecanosticta acicola]